MNEPSGKERSASPTTNKDIEEHDALHHQYYAWLRKARQSYCRCTGSSIRAQDDPSKQQGTESPWTRRKRACTLRACATTHERQSYTHMAVSRGDSASSTRLPEHTRAAEPGQQARGRVLSSLSMKRSIIALADGKI